MRKGKLYQCMITQSKMFVLNVWADSEKKAIQECERVKSIHNLGDSHKADKVMSEGYIEGIHTMWTNDDATEIMIEDIHKSRRDEQLKFQGGKV